MNTILDSPKGVLEFLDTNQVLTGMVTRVVLEVLLNHPNGIPRCCLRKELVTKDIDSGQVAGIIREIRNSGFSIEKRVRKFCNVHQKTSTFDRIEQPYLQGNVFKRLALDRKTRTQIKAILGGRDAFDNCKSSHLEVDHRIPIIREALGIAKKEARVDTGDPLSVVAKFQLLSSHNNLYKSRVCESCVESGVKPFKFMIASIPRECGGGMRWEEGKNDCYTCPYAFPEKFAAVSLSPIISTVSIYDNSK